MIKPITPEQLKAQRVELVPEFVYGVINELLVRTEPSSGNKIVIKQEDLHGVLSKSFVSSTARDINVDRALREYVNSGWKVTKSVFDWDDPIKY